MKYQDVDSIDLSILMYQIKIKQQKKVNRLIKVAKFKQMIYNIFN